MAVAHTEQPREHRAAAALLADAAARARTGAGGLVLLRGATGTGRTTVLEAAAESAAGHGMRVLRARCAPADAAVPFAAALQLLGPLTEFDATGSERELGAVLRRTLDAYAGQSPLLVAVDDVHLADPPSYRWLVETARHLDRLPLPILLAVTERSQYDVDPPAPGFTHTLSPALVRTHTLAPLTPDSAAGLVRARFPDADASWTGDCVRAGAGSPLLLRALLDDLAASGRPEAVPATCAALYPGEYQAAVSWWLDSAGPGTAEVARALAVLDEGWDQKGAGTGRLPAGPDGPRDLAGPPLDRVPDRLGALLAELACADPARVAGWLTAMTGLGLLRPDELDRPRYAHPLLRDAVLTGVPVARRRAAHHTAAPPPSPWPGNCSCPTRCTPPGPPRCSRTPPRSPCATTAPRTPWRSCAAPWTSRCPTPAGNGC